MPAQWCTETYCRSALIPYATDQIADSEITPAIAKAQGFIRAKILEPIAAAADSAVSLSDSAPLKVACALYTCYLVLRTRFMDRGPTANPWVREIKDDVEKLIEACAYNPERALGGVSLGETAMNGLMFSSTLGLYKATTLLDETYWQQDPARLAQEAGERGVVP